MLNDLIYDFFPSGNRMAAIPHHAHHFGGGHMSHYGGDSYEDVIRRAESLFNKIRYSVAQQVH